MTQQRHSSRRSLGRVLAALLALQPVGCSLVAPFEGVPSLPPAGASEAEPLVAVCYNRLFTTPDRVRKVAEEACGASATPELIGQDVRGMCPLLTPARASFVCAPHQAQP